MIDPILVIRERKKLKRSNKEGLSQQWNESIVIRTGKG